MYAFSLQSFLSSIRILPFVNTIPQEHVYTNSFFLLLLKTNKQTDFSSSLIVNSCGRAITTSCIDIGLGKAALGPLLSMYQVQPICGEDKAFLQASGAKVLGRTDPIPGHTVHPSCHVGPTVFHSPGIRPQLCYSVGQRGSIVDSVSLSL